MVDGCVHVPHCLLCCISSLAVIRVSNQCVLSFCLPFLSAWLQLVGKVGRAMEGPTSYDGEDGRMDEYESEDA